MYTKIYGEVCGAFSPDLVQTMRKAAGSRLCIGATQITEKQSAKDAVSAEIASITANIDTLKADLKTRKALLKKLDKELAKLESKKTAVETKAAEAAKKSEAEEVLKKLLASGMSADEILAKLK